MLYVSSFCVGYVIGGTAWLFIGDCSSPLIDVIHGSVYYYYYPSPTRSVCEDTLVIPSTCIRERDIVVTLLVRVSVCLSVCLCVSS